MNPENMMSSDRNEIQRAILFHVYEMCRTGKFIETERLVVARKGGWAKWEASANGYGVSFWGYTNVLKVHNTENTVKTMNYTLTMGEF